MNGLAKAFSFPFKDPDWVSKFLLAMLFMLLSFFLLGIFILAGYFVQVTQRVMKREPNPMPDWSDVGVKFVLGFKFCIMYMLYILPVFILYIPFLVLMGISALSESGEAVGALAAAYGMGVLLLIIVPYSLVLTFISPIITYRFAERERISDALDIAAVLRAFARNWENTLVVALLGVAISSLAWFGIVFFILGVFFTIFYSYLVMSYMNGLLFLERRPEAPR